MPPPLISAGACLALNAASIGLVLDRLEPTTRTRNRPRLGTAIAGGMVAAVTALQHWTGASEYDDAFEEAQEQRKLLPASVVLAVTQLLTLGAWYALASSSAKQRPLRSVLGSLLVLLTLARLDPLAAALLCAASWALRTAIAQSQPQPQPPPLVPTAVLAVTLCWSLAVAWWPGKDELLGAASAASWWPDSGAWWYMMTEAFHSFQPYFRLVLAAHPFLYLAPVAIRVAGSKKQPTSTHTHALYLLASLAIAHVFRPRPQPAHIAASVGAFLLLLPPQTLDGMRYKLLLCGVGLGVAGVLMPVMAHLWLRARSGNANYLFFQGYVWNVFLCLVLLEMVLALVWLGDGIDEEGKERGTRGGRKEE